jgi:ribosomal protein S18 acetylase RimI-like enzyme
MHKTILDSKRSPSDLEPSHASLPDMLVAQLGPSHRRCIAAHLLALSATDRRLRFGHSISDASISDYVRRIRFVRDAAFGAFDDSGRLIGFGHLALGAEGAEFALSVDGAARRHGIGCALLERANTHARNRGYDVLAMVYMPENDALASLARRAGMQVVCEPGECRAYVGLESPTAHSVLHEAWREAVSALDLGFRLADPAAATSA